MAAPSARRLVVDEASLREFCSRWMITELAVFGSALRDDFRPDSDIDLLVTFADDEHWRFGDLLCMQEELARFFGRPVDLVERKAVEENPNWIVRRAILGSARPLNVSG